jgi:hypothetical protein
MLTRLRKRYDHQTLTALGARLWSHMTLPIVCTMFLFMAFMYADKFAPKPYPGILMALGFLALSVTFGMFVCLVFISAFDAALHTKSRGIWRLLSVTVSSLPFLAVVFGVAYTAYVIARAAFWSR